MAEVKPRYPETLFRFRPYTPLSLKELQYGEIFFASRDELNDPYDTKNPAYFDADVENYKQLILGLLHKNCLGGLLDVDGVEEIACFLAKKSLLQDELLDLLASTEFETIVRKVFRKKLLAETASIFIDRFKQAILNAGGLCYIASFSKINDDPVMWSHYANRHRGFCLCFSNTDGILQRDRRFEKDHFFLQSKFEEVNYENKNVTTNGNMMLLKNIYGAEDLEQARKNYWELRRKSYLTKFTSWSYEQEVRVIVDDWFDVTSSPNEVMKKTIAERTFYYDQRQLIGIILGTKLSNQERKEIRAAIYNVRQRLLIRDNEFFNGRFSGVYLPIFLFYEAYENTNDFKMKIVPINGLDAVNSHFTIDKLEDKQRELNNLKELYRKQDEYRKAKNLEGPVGVNGTFLTGEEQKQ